MATQDDGSNPSLRRALEKSARAHIVEGLAERTRLREHPEAPPNRYVIGGDIPSTPEALSKHLKLLQQASAKYHALVDHLPAALQKAIDEERAKLDAIEGLSDQAKSRHMEAFKVRAAKQNAAIGQEDRNAALKEVHKLADEIEAAEASFRSPIQFLMTSTLTSARRVYSDMIRGAGASALQDYATRALRTADASLAAAVLDRAGELSPRESKQLGLDRAGFAEAFVRTPVVAAQAAILSADLTRRRALLADQVGRDAIEPSQLAALHLEHGLIAREIEAMTNSLPAEVTA